jgi:hypothetical protein
MGAEFRITVALGLIAAAVAAIVACDHVGPEAEADPAPDTDVDTDSDADADTDSDSDSDASDCPWNSGWPCTCSGVATCDDGSDCLDLDSWEWSIPGVGYCAESCDGNYVSCSDTAFTAQSQCAVTDGEDLFWCILICVHDSDCPSDQPCVDTGQGASICYPDGSGNPDVDVDTDTDTQFSECYGYEGDDPCCFEHNPCEWEENGVCDCDGACEEWDWFDCDDSPCEGYTGDDPCCLNNNPCDLALDDVCDCESTCAWDAVDCEW